LSSPAADCTERTTSEGRRASIMGAMDVVSDRPAAPALRRERIVVAAIVVLVVVARSAVFVFWPHAQFDSDQAVLGLMANHLSEGRAFPLFMYGQNYILGVEAWMAAPVFLAAGVSVATLKLPLLAVNLATALLLLMLL